MQCGGPAGLQPAAAGKRRSTFVCVHNATAQTEDAKLIAMWERRTPAEARATLSAPDVTVTNQSDKTTQVRARSASVRSPAAPGPGAATHHPARAPHAQIPTLTIPRLGPLVRSIGAQLEKIATLDDEARLVFSVEGCRALHQVCASRDSSTRSWALA